MKLLLAVLIASACAPTQTHDHVVSVAFAFQKYFVAFENDAIMVGHFQNIDDLIIQFGSIPDTWAGACANQGGEYHTPTITVSEKWWNTMADDQRQELIYHEMGHCVLNRGHKTTMWNGVPDSIMWPQVFPVGLFNQYHSHYVTELFTGAP